MAAQQWLGEINQFIFVFYTEYTHTHTLRHTRVQQKKKLKLWRKEKVYNKKRKENSEANRTQQSARQKQLQLQVAASVGDINNGDNDGTRRNPEKMYKSGENKGVGGNHPAETTGGAVAALKGFSHYI